MGAGHPWSLRWWAELKNDHTSTDHRPQCTSALCTHRHFSYRAVLDFVVHVCVNERSRALGKAPALAHSPRELAVMCGGGPRAAPTNKSKSR